MSGAVDFLCSVLMSVDGGTLSRRGEYSQASVRVERARLSWKGALDHRCLERIPW